MSYYQLIIEANEHRHIYTYPDINKICQNLIEEFIKTSLMYTFCNSNCEIFLNIFQDNKLIRTIVFNEKIYIQIDNLCIVGNHKKNNGIEMDYYSLDGIKYVNTDKNNIDKYLLRCISEKKLKLIIDKLTYANFVLKNDCVVKSISLNQILIGKKFMCAEFLEPNIKKDRTIEYPEEYFNEYYEEISLLDICIDDDNEKLYECMNFKIFIDYNSMKIPFLKGEKLSKYDSKYGCHNVGRYESIGHTNAKIKENDRFDDNPDDEN